MTILKVTVDDNHAELLKKLLQQTSFVKNVEEEYPVIDKDKRKVAYERIKDLLNKASEKNLFADIKDPAEWQRDLRKEWGRD